MPMSAIEKTNSLNAFSIKALRPIFLIHVFLSFYS